VNDRSGDESHQDLFTAAGEASEVESEALLSALRLLPPPPRGAQAIAVVAFLVQQREGCGATLLSAVRDAVEAESAAHRTDVAAEIQRRLDAQRMRDAADARAALTRELTSGRNDGFFGPNFDPRLTTLPPPPVNEPFTVSADATALAAADVFDPLARWRGASVLAAQFSHGESVLLARARTTVEMDLASELLFPYRYDGRSGGNCLLPLFGHGSDARLIVDDVGAWRGSLMRPAETEVETLAVASASRARTRTRRAATMQVAAAGGAADGGRPSEHDYASVFAPPDESVQFGASFPAFFAYDGSLTTRPCNQTVSWLVGASPVAASAADIKFFQSLFFGNARRVQRLGARRVSATPTALLVT
jgi:hypothetical protein